MHEMSIAGKHADSTCFIFCDSMEIISWLSENLCGNGIYRNENILITKKFYSMNFLDTEGESPFNTSKLI